MYKSSVKFFVQAVIDSLAYASPTWEHTGEVSRDLSLRDLLNEITELKASPNVHWDYLMEALKTAKSFMPPEDWEEILDYIDRLWRMGEKSPIPRHAKFSCWLAAVGVELLAEL